MSNDLRILYQGYSMECKIETQSNCPGMFSQCNLFYVRKGTSCELTPNVS